MQLHIRPSEPTKRDMLRVSWLDYHKYCRFLAAAMRSHIPQLIEPRAYPDKPMFLVPITRGGMIACQILAYELDLAVRGGIQVTSYDGTGQHGIPRINHDAIQSDITVPSRSIIFVDDIVDSGDTFIYLQKRYPEALFVAPMGKVKGCSKQPLTNFPITPPHMSPDNQWIEFPWDSSRHIPSKQLPF